MEWPAQPLVTAELELEQPREDSAIANASGWINSAFQVESETTKLLKLAKSLKGHSSFTASAISWLG